MVAAVLGRLALNQAREATKWAEKSAELQDWANRLSEAALPVGFNVRMVYVMYHDGGQPGRCFDACLELEGNGSAVFIHKLETAESFFGRAHSNDPTIWFDTVGGQPIMPIEDELPKRVLAGEKVRFDNPWSSFSPRLALNRTGFNRDFLS